VTAAEKADDSAMLAENLHGVANMLVRLGQYREAIPFSEREVALVEKAGQPEPIVRALSTYAQELEELGRLRESLPLLERAVEFSRRSSQPVDYHNTLGNLAVAYLSLGDYETGLRMMKSISSPTPIDLNLIAISEHRLHRDVEAEADYRAAIAAPVAPVLWRIHAGALANLAILLHSQNRLDEARSCAMQSLYLAETHKDDQLRVLALGTLSQIAAEQKDVPEALRLAQEAIDLARELEDPKTIVDALVAQAHALEVAGRNPESDALFTEAISLTEGLRADTPASAAGLQGELDQWLPTYQYAIEHVVRTGKAVEALRLADRAKARVLLDMLDRGQPSLDALADPQERAGEQAVRSDVARFRQAAVAKPDPASKAALEASLRKEDDFNLRLYGRHPELVIQRATAPDIRPEELAALTRGSTTALLSYFVLQNTVALFVVRPGGSVNVFTLAGTDKLDGLIRSFRSQIAARDLDYRVSAKALYNALLGPAATALRGTDRWILSPDGSLWDVPFQALMDPQGKHVLETHALSYAPSFSVLRELQEKTPAQASQALLAMAPIAESQREASAIAAVYPSGRSTVLAGSRATAASFRDKAKDATVIHIASHAETETNHPLESFLLFAGDGAVTARDLLGMRLRADLVVLSACETARGKIGQGDGVMGLGWAVLAAGARASVLSQWKVDSGATGDLMVDFHRRLAGRKTDKAEALRQASLATMRSPGRLHPFYWAGFIVLGDAR
jgi:CHAT domain-containing protein/tetratricopeptide (TPR) repeat protein